MMPPIRRAALLHGLFDFQFVFIIGLEPLQFKEWGEVGRIFGDMVKIQGENMGICQCEGVQGGSEWFSCEKKQVVRNPPIIKFEAKRCCKLSLESGRARLGDTFLYLSNLEMCLLYDIVAALPRGGMENSPKGMSAFIKFAKVLCDLIKL